MSEKFFRNDNSFGTFRKSDKISHQDNISYYYQNSKYHILRRDLPDNSGIANDKNSFKTITSFDNIHEIFIV